MNVINYMLRYDYIRSFVMLRNARNVNKKEQKCIRYSVGCLSCHSCTKDFKKYSLSKKKFH